METLRDATSRLAEAGYTACFVVENATLVETQTRRAFAPESLSVDEIVRFEGASDPQEEAALYALRSKDGETRGTFVVAFGPGVDPDSAEIVRRLPRIDAS